MGIIFCLYSPIVMHIINCCHRRPCRRHRRLFHRPRMGGHHRPSHQGPLEVLSPVDFRAIPSAFGVRQGHAGRRCIWLRRRKVIVCGTFSVRNVPRHLDLRGHGCGAFLDHYNQLSSRKQRRPRRSLSQSARDVPGHHVEDTPSSPFGRTSV